MAALLITVAQILWALVHSPGPGGLSERYLRLNQWDSQHYLSISREGYHLPPHRPITARDVHEDRANAGYFPAYPLAAQGLARLGVSHKIALLLTAQLACFVFWSAFFAWVRRRGFSLRAARAAAGCIALYPASFFLVAGYSESLFLAAFMGFVLLWEKSKVHVGFGAASAVSGFVLTATRVVGIPLAVYPAVSDLAQVLGEKKRLPAISKALAATVSSLAVCGALSYFAWCELHLGSWKTYFDLQHTGWGNHPRWWAIIDPLSYVPRFFFENTVTSVSRASNLFILGTASLCFLLERKCGRRAWLSRLGLYFCAFWLFFIPVSGKADDHMDSMVRYNLPVFVTLVLAVVDAARDPRGARAVREFWQRRKSAWLVTAVFCLALQSWMLFLFLRGRWVA